MIKLFALLILLSSCAEINPNLTLECHYEDWGAKTILICKEVPK